MRIDPPLVIAKGRDLVGCEEFELGDADTVFARDHSIQRPGQGHDAGHGGIGLLQHAVVIGVDRQVGVHIAITRMHVQRHKHPAAQNALVGFSEALEHGPQGLPRKQPGERSQQLGLPGHANAAVLEHVKEGLRGFRR